MLWSMFCRYTCSMDLNTPASMTEAFTVMGSEPLRVVGWRTVVIWPKGSVTPLVAERVQGGVPWRVTETRGRGFPAVSYTVTVMVEVSMPFATIQSLPEIII